MVANLKDLEDRITQLLPEDRSRLIQDLIGSLDTGEDVDAEGTWLAVAEQRYQDYRAGKLTSKSADELFEEARSKM